MGVASILVAMTFHYDITLLNVITRSGGQWDKNQ